MIDTGPNSVYPPEILDIALERRPLSSKAFVIARENAPPPHE